MPDATHRKPYPHWEPLGGLDAVTMSKDDLHELVDRLRDEDTEQARRMLQELVRHAEAEGPADPESDVSLEELLEEHAHLFEGLREWSEQVKDGYNPKW